MWEEVAGASHRISVDFQWIGVDILHVDLYLYLYYLQGISTLQPSPKLNSSFLGMPIGPLWAHKGPILGKKLIILIKNHKIIDKNLKIVNLEILKVKTWFWNKDLSSLDSIN